MPHYKYVPLLTNALESELEAISFLEDDNNNGILWGDDGPSSVSRLLCTLKLATIVLALYPYAEYYLIVHADESCVNIDS